MKNLWFQLLIHQRDMIQRLTRLTGYIALMLLPVLSLAQSKVESFSLELDSLERLIKTNLVLAEQYHHELQEKSTKINSEFEIARAVYLNGLLSDKLGKLNKADSIYQLATSRFEALGADSVVAYINYIRSIVTSKQSEFDKSDELSNRAIAYFLSQKDFYSASKAYSVRGINFNIQRRYDSSIVYFNKTIHYAQLAGSKVMMFRTRYNMIHILKSEDKYYESLENAFQLLALSDSLPNPIFKVQANLALGVTYTFVRDYDKSEEYLKRSLQLYEEHQLKDLTYLALIYANLGALNRGSNEERIAFLEKALAIQKKMGNNFDQVNTLNSLSKKHFKSDPKKAIELAEESMEISKLFGPDYINLDAMAGKMAALASFGQFRRALAYAPILEKHIDNLEYTHLYWLYVSYKGDGQMKKAFEILEKHVEVKDESREQDFVRAAALAEAKFQYEQDSKINAIEKEQTRMTFESELQRQQFIQYVAFASLAIFLIISFILFRFYKVKKRDNRLLALKNEEINQKSEILKTTNEKLVALDRFKEAMTGMIAHDLKNPLSAILRRLSQDRTTQGMAKQMLQLVNNLLDVQKFENTEVQLNTESIVFADLVTDAKGQVAWLLAEKNIQLKASETGKVCVLGDREILLRVLVNLLTNAIKYSDSNTIIEIKTILSDDKVEIAVADQGYGIPQEQVDQIFDSFTQINPKSSGGVASTGLGLTFCKLALKAHGSSISVESVLGEGTTFLFVLTRSEERELTFTDMAKPQFKITSEERDAILEKLPRLRALKLYQAFEIEEVLDSISKQAGPSVNDWVESVLNAAYTGNQRYYDELLEGLELYT